MREAVQDAFRAGPQDIDEYSTGKYRHVAELGPELRVGHGVSYSDLRHGDPELSREEIVLAELAVGERVTVSVTVTNPSERDAEEYLLLFVHDRIASVAPRRGSSSTSSG